MASTKSTGRLETRSSGDNNRMSPRSAPSKGLVGAQRDADPSIHLELRDVSKQFGTGGPWAVSHSSFTVSRGEFFGLLGPSGCGKSTTLNLIAGFLDPSMGEIRLSGNLLNGVPPHKRGTAMVFQDYALFPHLSAADNVAFGLTLLKRPKDVIKRRVQELLDLVGLSHRADNLPAQLSGGEQQRVAVARALAIDPEVVLLDEPLSNLDARLRVQMRRDLKRILGEAGVTVIFVTHDQSEAFAICDRIAVMLHGVAQDIGTPVSLYKRPRTQAVAKFVGEGNFLPAVVRETAQAQTRLALTVGDQQVQSATRGQYMPGQSGTLLVRPEAISLSAGDESETGLRGIVRHAEFQGALTQYQIDVSGVIILVYQVSPEQPFTSGESVRLAWTADESVFFPSEEEGMEA